jgi:predicted transposase YbfD/YdcC
LSKKTVKLIVEKGNDYVVKVKENQQRLLDEMMIIESKEQAQDCFIKEEVNRGRKEKREIKLFSASAPIKQQWAGAQTIVYVERTTIRKGVESLTKSYYLSSLKISGAKMLEGIRGHWRIENSLHYVKDVVTHEDASRIKSTNAAAVYALVRNLAVSVYRIKGWKSIKNAIRACAGNINVLLKTLE